MKTKTMKEETISMQDIIFAIPSMPKLAATLLNKGKDYDALLIEILKTDYFSEDRHFPTPKELQQKLNLSYGRFRKQINLLYEDFMKSISSPDTALVLGDKLCEIYVHYFHLETAFYARLSVLPKVGEQMELPFIRPLFRGHDLFHVQSVTHCVVNDRIDFKMWLTVGAFNLFEHLEKDHAKSENRFDFMNDRIIEGEHHRRRAELNAETRKFW